MRGRGLRALAVALIALGTCALVRAQALATSDGAPITIEDLLREPQYAQVVLSPNGRRLFVVLDIR